MAVSTAFIAFHVSPMPGTIAKKEPRESRQKSHPVSKFSRPTVSGKIACKSKTVVKLKSKRGSKL